MNTGTPTSVYGMTVKALVFDVDGTLAETERDGHRPAFNAAFAAAGLSWHWNEELYGELLAVTGGKERMHHYASTADQHFLTDSAHQAVIADLHVDKTARYVQIVESGLISLRPGVENLIRQARAAGIRLAIATTTSPDNVTALLRATLGPDAVTWFEVIGAGDVVPQKKPAPDIYNWVLDRMSLRPGDCVAIEDSIAGLHAALAARIPTIITPGVYTRGEKFSGALAVLPDLSGVSLADLVALHESPKNPV